MNAAGLWDRVIIFSISSRKEVWNASGIGVRWLVGREARNGMASRMVKNGDREDASELVGGG